MEELILIEFLIRYAGIQPGEKAIVTRPVADSWKAAGICKIIQVISNEYTGSVVRLYPN